MEKKEVVSCPQCHLEQEWKEQNKCRNGCLWSRWFCDRIKEAIGRTKS